MLRRSSTNIISATLGIAALVVVAAPVRAEGPDNTRKQWKTGAGQPKAHVVYLHGLGDTPKNFLSERVVRGLQQRGICLDIVAPQLRQNGATQTMTGQLAAAKAEIAKLPGKVVLMGHSFGGIGALALEKQMPDKIACKVLLAPSVNMVHSYWKHYVEPGAQPPADKQQVVAGLERAGRQIDHLLAQARAAKDLGQVKKLTGAVAYNKTMLDLAKYDEPKLLKGVRGPTLMLSGTEDGHVSKHYARRVGTDPSNPGIEFHEIPGAHHFLEVLKAPERGPRGQMIQKLDRAATDRLTNQVVDQIARFVDQHAGD